MFVNEFLPSVSFDLHLTNLIASEKSECHESATDVITEEWTCVCYSIVCASMSHQWHFPEHMLAALFALTVSSSLRPVEVLQVNSLPGRFRQLQHQRIPVALSSNLDRCRMLLTWMSDQGNIINVCRIRNINFSCSFPHICYFAGLFCAVVLGHIHDLCSHLRNMMLMSNFLCT